MSEEVRAYKTYVCSNQGCSVYKLEFYTNDNKCTECGREYIEDEND